MSVYTFAQLCTHYITAFNKDKVYIIVHLSPLGFTQYRPHLTDMFFANIKVIQCLSAQRWIFNEARRDK